MRAFLLLVFILNINLFAQQPIQLMVEWDADYWHRPMIQYKYPEWPQRSIINLYIISAQQIDLEFNNYRKSILLRDGQNPNMFISNPNLLKRILFGMRENNSMVNIYSISGPYRTQNSNRIRGSLDPNKNYLPSSIKY
ncbi:MAG: hypothetical protein EBU90_23615 [Proteobacteria bacterium]|nr:hypothetical protein [Pseudomonadota bacterium]NBP16089.1 hypothetical protein [bacterium]